jgi:hypothetical protein
MAESKTIKARFVGDPRNPGEPIPDVFDAFGTTFEKGKFAEVDAQHADKLRGNDHFEVQGEKKAEAPAETAETTAEFASRVNEITDREGLEAMLKTTKGPAAKSVIERRLEALPQAEA